MPRETSSKASKIIFSVFMVVILAILAGFARAIYPIYKQSCDLRREYENDAARIHAKQCEIDELRTQQRRLNSDKEFVESLARRNRRVFPGELVFIFGE